ncbi:lysine transporter LysM [Photobacterium angustum]|uniref:Lysine transporter LysM n=2 Tax=Photobacterium angustum TaxID=661 RepID=A0A855S719_PHOAN|nr:LysM-like peptidoglycan-binding domain-containing protein [Photobacterium angustum]KJF83647.1 lysine transporter LysM [Photobacterium damselae subsp. damselae]KJG27758.1 lysine transporter LysM [Photobacterium angustum]KJG35609.1 lysine transporter LysM [Photobacterium angustum]KJG44752.1 lysine transporter LysM [Photobacterium angustum]KJG47955.1 lysine transporter LysM [Photobacterium angustum]
MILVPIFVAVLMLPSPKQLEQEQNADSGVRRNISLNLGGSTSTTQAVGKTGTTSSNTVTRKRTDIVLDTADIREDSKMKAIGGTEDNGPAPEKKPMIQKIYPLDGGKAYTVDLSKEAAVATKATDKPKTTNITTTANTTKVASSDAGQWVSYKVPAGETLANVFRDRSLPLSDLYKIANIEGAGKPISNVQAGQTLKYRVNSNGQIDGLKIEGNGISAAYYRSSNGSYYRK